MKSAPRKRKALFFKEKPKGYSKVKEDLYEKLKGMEYFKDKRLTPDLETSCSGHECST